MRLQSKFMSCDRDAGHMLGLGVPVPTNPAQMDQCTACGVSISLEILRAYYLTQWLPTATHDFREGLLRTALFPSMESPSLIQRTRITMATPWVA